MNTSASSPVAALLALLTESSEAERAPGSAGTGDALEESFAALLAGLTLPEQRASDAVDSADEDTPLADPDVGTQLHSLLRNLRSTNTQSSVIHDFSAASTHDEALLHAAIAAVSTLTNESADADRLTGDGASSQPARIAVPEATRASATAGPTGEGGQSVAAAPASTPITTGSDPDSSIPQTQVIGGLGRGTSRPARLLADGADLPGEGVTAVEVGGRTPDSPTAGSTPPTADASLRGAAEGIAPITVPDGRHGAADLTPAPSRPTTAASPSPVRDGAVESPPGIRAEAAALGLADGPDPQPEPSRPPDEQRVVLRTATAERPASPDASTSPSRAEEGTATLDAAPLQADTPDLPAIRTARPGLPAAVERVMEAIADLEHAPPPRRLTLEIGEARVRVAIEDGEVRMTALTDDADTRDLLDAAEAQIADRGPDPGSDGRQDRGHPDGDRGEQDPGVPVPSRRVDHGLRL